MILEDLVPRGVFSGDLRQLPEEDNVVPLHSFLLMIVFRIGLGSSEAEGTNGASVLEKLLLRSFAIHLKMISVVQVSAINFAFSDH
jgi:hypothetical protein